MRCASFVAASIAAVLLSALPAARASAQDPALTESAAQNRFAHAVSSLEWRHIGPVNMGGRVSAIAGVPDNPKTFWVGGADGGVWKTANGGTTFEGQWQDEEAYSVGALAVAPSDHNVVWLGSGEADPRNSVSYGLGVWRSTDGGTSWTHVGLRETERIHRIAVDPRDPDVAWVCAMGREWGPNPERGVFKTTDAGATWTKVLYIDEDTGCSDLDIDLSNPRNVYAGMWTFRRRPWRFDDGGRETALYVSRDAGEAWKKIETLPDEPMARIGLSVAQSRPNIVYLITEFATAGTLFRSEDHGETWTMVNDDRNLNFRPFYYSDVTVDPSNENIIYTLSGRLSKSTDGGRTFERIANDVHGDHQAFWIDPADGERLLSGSDGGYQVSYDGGETFHIFRNLSLAQYYHVFVDDRDPYYVCGGLQDNGNWCGPSRTNEPDGILAGEWYTVSGGDGFYTVPVPGQPNLVYSNAQGGYFRITDTNSGTTRSIEPYPWMVGSQGQNMQQARHRFNWDAPIHISPHDPNVVYWGGNVLFRSADYGHSWEVVSPDLTTNDPEKQRDSGGEIYNDNTAAEFHTTILSIAESPVEQGVIWVGTDDGNIQVTRDGGATWTNVRENVPGLPPETWIGNIEASPTEPGVAFVAVDNHRLDDFTPHLYETRDYGETWRDLSGGLPQDDYVKVVRQHPKNANLLFVGMERGILASFDRGESWIDIRGNLPRVSVRGIKIEPRYNDLVIGTHGRGAFILDDIQPLVELADAVEKDVHLFAARTATDWEMWSRGSNLGQSTFRGENPEPGAYIHYYLSEAAAGRVNARVADENEDDGNGASRPREAQARGVIIRITDASSALVREISDTAAQAGINRTVWDLRWTSPRRRGDGPPQGSFGGGGAGVTAVPGTYTATLVADGQDLSSSFKVRGDPNANLSQADHEARFAAARRAEALDTQLDEIVAVTRDLTEQIDNTLTAIEGKDVTGAAAIGTAATAAKDALKALADQTTRPPGSMNYRDWPRLAEQLRFVARNINGAQAKPTAGQLEVLALVEQEAADRAAELNGIINGPIAELNRLLEGQPQILSDWPPRPATIIPEA
ncbi:MAG: WD40/YVTN/BNR-like repeat-containing protein [Longimicrobiales bacterium]